MAQEYILCHHYYHDYHNYHHYTEWPGERMYMYMYMYITQSSSTL